MGRKLGVALAVMAMFTGSLLGSGCGGDKSSTKPDPNAGLYGTWNGTLNMAFPGGNTQDGITIVMDKSSVAYYMSGAQYPVTGYNYADPNVTVNVNAFGYVLSLTGTRAGGTINGAATVTAAGGTGAWASTKASVPLLRATAGRKMIEVLKPR